MSLPTQQKYKTMPYNVLPNTTEVTARSLLATNSAISCSCTIRVASDLTEIFEGHFTSLGQQKHESVNLTTIKMAAAVSTFCKTRSRAYYFHLQYESNKNRSTNTNFAHKF